MENKYTCSSLPDTPGNTSFLGERGGVARESFTGADVSGGESRVVSALG